MTLGPDQVRSLFDRIDIYVFDQILRGRLGPGMRILDAGCGGGRNSSYLMRCGADVHAIDISPENVAAVASLATDLAPALPRSNFRVARITEIPFPDEHFDAVVCNAVLHFAEDRTEFDAMVTEMFRVLVPGGVFFARLATTIGVEGVVEAREHGWYRLPDGTDRFLVDEADLLETGERLEAELIDPIKTTNVQNLRAMTTWVLRKREPAGEA